MSRGVRRGVARFFIVGGVGLLFIALFIILLAALAPIALRVGKLLVGPILWVYESRDYLVGLSLTGSVTPAIVAITLAGLLHKRRHRVMPAIMANECFWVFVIIYVVVITALPLTLPAAASVLLSLNTPMILAAPLIFITAFGLARDVNEGGYWVAAEAYITLFTSLLIPDLATALMAGIATETVHLFTKASFVIGGYGIMDGLVLIPIEAITVAIITTVIIKQAFIFRHIKNDL